MHAPFYHTLVDSAQPIGLRYQAVFELKSLATLPAIHSLIQAYPSCGNSILLKHQLLYALGQLSKDMYPQVREFLLAKMDDEQENALSRHEAAEALANYFDQSLVESYDKHLESECKELRWTCQIAKEKVLQLNLEKEYGKLYSNTMEPAAPFSKEEFQAFLAGSLHLANLFKEQGFLGLLCEQEIPLFFKYRLMYYMRNLNTPECRETLCRLLSREYFQTQTSLLKHEVCFIIGQVGCEGLEHLIRECLENEKEEDIVRHEALAAVASQSKDGEYLVKFLGGEYSQLIRESAEVAIHTIKYWNDAE